MSKENHEGVASPFDQIWVCETCGFARGPSIPEDVGEWRWTGEEWQHRCPGLHGNVGHMRAVPLSEAKSITTHYPCPHGGEAAECNYCSPDGTESWGSAGDHQGDA